jgi:hypothetical protein
MMNAPRLLLAVAAASSIAMCDKGKSAASNGAGDSSASAPSEASSGDGKDPCTLVTQAEAEKWLGPLAHAPYRSASRGDPLASGTYCRYLAGDGRFILIEPDWQDAGPGFAAVKMGSSLTGQVFTEDNGKTDTLEGAWDDARWLGAGSTFFAIKGDQMVAVNVASSRGGIAAAADLSSKALPRFPHPLDYDGAKAVAGAPAIRETGDACALLTTAEIEAIAGPLNGPPVPSGRGESTDCKYNIKGKSGPVILEVSVGWHGGFEHFAGSKVVMASVMGQTAGMQQAHAKTGQATKAEGASKPQGAAADPEMQKVMGALQAMGKTQGIHMNDQGGLMHDTAVAGPWAEGAMLGGVSFVAVKQDVGVSMAFTDLTLDQVTALMAKAMARIQ